MRAECESRPSFRALLVEDEPVAARLLAAALGRLGALVTPAATLQAARQRLEADPPPDLCVLDLSLPDGDGLTLLATLRRLGVPAIVQTASERVDLAVEAMRAGASDFLVKPVAPRRLAEAVRGALGRGAGEEAGRQPLSPMGRALHLADRVARSDAPVLLTGETGVGKEWLARRIAAGGARADRPFLALNCAALPLELAESLLFGHERGSFSGAGGRHLGRFAEADGGTLLLDEIGELPLALQAKLLRALDNGEIDPLGARRPRRVDVRVIAATHRPLAAMAREGRFRADLYWRLAVFEIAVPPLRERRDEIEALAVRFAAEAGRAGRPRRIEAAALRQLARRPWPGNIRELRHAVERAAILGEGDTLGPADFALPEPPQGPVPSGANAAAPAPPSEAGAFRGADGRPKPLHEVEREAIREAVRFHGGSLAAAARSLRIGRSTLYRKLEETSDRSADRAKADTSPADFTGR